MSLTKSAPPLQIELHVSRLLAGIIIVSHVTALLVVLLLPVSWWWRVLMFSGIIVSAYYVMMFHVLRRSPYSVKRLVWHQDGSWTLTRRNGQQSSACLSADSYVHAELIVLNLYGEWGRLSLVLLRDAADHQTLRRMRVRLFQEGLPQQVRT